MAAKYFFDLASSRGFATWADPGARIHELVTVTFTLNDDGVELQIEKLRDLGAEIRDLEQ